MEEDVKRKYVEAGKVNKQVLNFAKEYIKEGRSLLDIAETLEKKISFYSDGRAKPAWPVNLSIDENAAHQTASLEEEIVLSGKELIKVDVGVHIDGYISDAAITIDLSGENGKLIEASENALENAISEFDKSRNLGDIGKIVENTIKSKGFKTIINLTGHFLERWINHAEPNIPNINTNKNLIVDFDCVFAIEPFATNGVGKVKESNKAEIFAIKEIKPVRNQHSRKLLEIIEEKYKTLPFAERWIAKEIKMSEFHRKIAVKELLRTGCLRAFPILHEEKGSLVAQSETTLLIDGNELIRLT